MTFTLISIIHNHNYVKFIYFFQIIEEAQFSFICGNQTIFSQESLTCTHRDESYPCGEAEALYDLSNRDFGRIPDDTLIQQFK